MEVLRRRPRDPPGISTAGKAMPWRPARLSLLHTFNWARVSRPHPSDRAGNGSVSKTTALDERRIKGFWVGDWLVEPALSRVKRADERRHIEPRSMAVLECLVVHAGDVLSKERLIEAVWGDAFVGDEVLSHAIWDLRRSLGDDARSPEYIQTITKRGYRLIAPVRPLTRGGSAPSERRRWIARAAAAVALAAAAALVVWLLEPEGRDALATRAPRADGSALPRLAITEQRGAGEPARLERVLDELSAVTTFEVAARLPPRTYPYSARDHGLEILGAAGRGPGVALFRLYSLATGATVWSGSARFGPGSEEASGQRLAERLRLFGEINAHPLYHDAHLRPWFNLRRHDWRAVLFFLRGAQRTYDFELGDGEDYLVSMRLDERFLAPVAWGLGACQRVFGDDCRARLESLRAGDHSFDSAVAAFLLHTLDDNLLLAHRSLRDALERAPGNGPVRVNLARIEYAVGDGDPARALATLTPLIDEGWRYPSLYPQAANYALELGRFDLARQFLLQGVECEPDVVDTLVLLEALALLDRDTAAAERWYRRYQRRLQVLEPQERALMVDHGYEAIVRRAKTEGRIETVQALHERRLEIFGQAG